MNHFMDLLDILFTSFYGRARYPFYIISWTCSISSLHHFMDLLDILFTSFHVLKEDIEQIHEMMQRGYRANPWNDVNRISSKSMNHFMDLLDLLFTSFHGLARYPLYIISWTYSITSLHHFMDFLDILFTSF
jgi:hypothetical protein